MNHLVSKGWDKLPATTKRNKILHLQDVCAKEPQIDFKLKEYFCNGLYAREITMPKGSLLVGEIHLTEHLSVISSGSVRVVSEFDEDTYTAPCTYIGKAGTKRVALALEETVWTVFHVTKHTNTADIRKDFIAASYEEFDRKVRT